MSRPLIKRVVMPLLARIGLDGPTRTAWSVLKNSAAQVRGWEVEFDYWKFRRDHRFLKGALPAPASGSRILVVNLLSDTIGWLKVEALLAKSLQLRGHRPIVLTFSYADRDLRYFREFGLTEFAFFDEYLQGADTAMLEREAEAVLQEYRTATELSAFQYRGAHVGRHVLSTVSMQLRKGRLMLSDPQIQDAVRVFLPRAMRATLAAQAIFDRLTPHAILLREKGYATFGEIYDLALNRGIDALSWNVSHQQSALVFKRYAPSTRHLHPFSLSPETWQSVREMAWTDARERELGAEIRGHYEADARFKGEPLQAGKKMKPEAEIRRQLRLDPGKKTAVIFSHVLWDGSLSYGDSLFEDYEQWLVETVRVVRDNPAVNWVLKFHPANAWKSKQLRYEGKLWDRLAIERDLGALPPHITVLDPDTDLNTYTLFGVTDYCITVRGTIGIEMACFGIRVFTAGSGRYSGMGFTEDSFTRAEYLKKLRTIQTFPRLSPEQTQLARKHAYALFRLRPWRAQSLEVSYLPVHKAGHPLNPNVVIRARSLEDLARAPDLTAFVSWATASTRPDFLVPTERV